MISFVILHYQALEETINCVTTIFEKVSGEFKVVIVDNCSPNGSGVKLKEMYKDDSGVTVILTEKNLGFAKGNNIGFQQAKKDNPDFIVVMNNDVFLQQNDFTDRVNKMYQKHQFDILGPDIFSTRDNIHQNPQRKKNYTLKELKSYWKWVHFKAKLSFLVRIKYILKPKQKETAKNKPYIDHPLENIVLHGACYIYAKKYIQSHENCFYDETFMYFESYLLHYLSNREKLKLVYDPDIKVIHHEDVATNQTYKKRYEKSIFVNQCLVDSCECFINAMENPNARIG